MDTKKLSKMTDEEFRERVKEIQRDYHMKSQFLKEFKIEELQLERLLEDEPERARELIGTADDIVELLKGRELTYEQAYATLRQAYNQLKYESNFLKI